MITDVAEILKHNVQWGMEELRIRWPNGEFSDYEMVSMTLVAGDTILAMHAEKKRQRAAKDAVRNAYACISVAAVIGFIFVWFFRRVL